MTASVRWDGAAYALSQSHHRVYDDYVLGPLQLEPGMRVLDVGSGSGELTARVASVVAPGEVVGLEPDESQLARARSQQQDAAITWVQGRAQEVADAVDGLFDVALSVAVLHWIPLADHTGILKALASLVKPGGRLRLDFGGHGQIAAVRALLGPIAAEFGTSSAWTFPTTAEYAPLLGAAGFDVTDGWLQLTTQQRAFPDAASFLAWLRSQVLIAYVGGLSDRAAADFAVAAEAVCLSELCASDGSFDQAYVRLDVLATRR